MNKVIAAVIAGILVLGGSSSAYALENKTSESVRSAVESTREHVTQTVEDAEDDVSTVTETTKQALIERKAALKDRIETERSELKSQLDTMRAERKTALSEKRLALCQERQAKINELMAASAKFGREKLERIQRFEEGVKKFYEEQQLSSAEYDTVVTLVDENEAAAIAAIEVAEAQNFNCEQVDGEKPSGEIKTAREARHQALNAYRDSVKQLIQIVKAAYEDKTATSDSESEGASL